jgi:hypothetical protein
MLNGCLMLKWTVYGKYEELLSCAVDSFVYLKMNLILSNILYETDTMTISWSTLL